MICAICPLKGDYEPDKPDWGFLFPAYSDRSTELNHIDIFQSDTAHPQLELLRTFGLDQK